MLTVPEFTGDGTCKSDDILKHITNATLRQIPSFFESVEILGASGRDMGATTVGQIALGGVTGSIGGIVAIDSVIGAVSLGKQARGASSNEGYRFGDFTRGSIRAVGEAAKKGASMRGGDNNAFQLGDFATGASAGVGSCASENKQRLGSAGGSSIGMTLGLVALGPVGLVAGCVLGGMAGSTAFGGDKKPNNRMSIEASNSENADRTVCDNEATSENTIEKISPSPLIHSFDPNVDLLDLGNVNYYPAGSLPHTDISNSIDLATSPSFGNLDILSDIPVA